MTNYSRNKAEINKFRKKLKAMLDDISDIDRRVLTKAVNAGLMDAKKNTPVVTGFMRKSWYTTPTKRTTQGVEKELANSADYSAYVNYGHRIVNKAGKTVGWVKGQFILEKAINHAEKIMVKEFEKEVERVNRKHDK